MITEKIKIITKKILRRNNINIERYKPDFPNLKSLTTLKEDLKSKSNQTHEKRPPITVHLFWAYGNLTRLEILCVNSFLHNGYNTNLWTYNSSINAPSGAIIKNANEVIPESEIFTYKNGSYAAFANLFRYAVLMKIGGLWCDTDVICLLPSDNLSSFDLNEIYVTEKTHIEDNISLNNNLIFLDKPTSGCLVDLALGVTKRFSTENLEWGSCGPRLLTGLAKLYPHLAKNLMEPDFANPINYTECPAKLLKPDQSIDPNWGFIHCYNEMWRRAGIEKNTPYPPNSILARLESKFS